MSRWAETTLAGWGRVHEARGLAARPERLAELGAVFDAGGSLLAHGAGRSYGDVALNSAGPDCRHDASSIAFCRSTPRRACSWPNRA